MEELLKNQQQNIKELLQIIENYGKDGANRKSKTDYFEKKLKILETWWVDFDATNTKLQAFSDEKQPYFEENKFEKSRDAYLKHRNTLQDGNKKLLEKIQQRQSTSTGNPDEGESDHDDSNGENDDSDGDIFEGESIPGEVEVLKFQLQELKDAIHSSKQIEHSQVEVTTSGLANAQLENVKIIWSEFRTAYRTIIASVNKKYCDQIDFKKWQNEYVMVCGFLNDKANAKGRSNIVLEKAKIPPFSGAPSEWRMFKDMFDEYVHNDPSYSNAAKMHYLKLSVRGDAAKLIGHISPSANNYSTCYKTLSNRYDNKRELVNDFINAILRIPTQKCESSESLRALYDQTNENLLGLSNIGVNVDSWDPIIINILSKKLDPKTILEFEMTLKNSREPPTLNSFLNYIESRFMAMAAAECGNKKSGVDSKNVQHKTDKKGVPFKCSYCEKPHSVYSCDDFKELEPEKRSEFIRAKKYCIVCLQEHKKGEACKSKFNCKICDKKHNVLLHFERKKSNSEKNALCAITANNVESDDEIIVSMNSSVVSKPTAVILATAMVRVVSRSGEKMYLRALIDAGSQSAFITAEAAQLLKIPKLSISATISGIGGGTKESKHSVMLTIHSRFPENEFNLSTEAIILSKLTNFTTTSDDVRRFEHLRNLCLADPISGQSQPIDLILGVVEHAKIIKSGLQKGNEDEPIAQNSEFGWLVFGGSNKPRNKRIKTVTLLSNIEMDQKLCELFNTDDIEDEIEEKWSEEELYCEKYFVETTTRDSSGRFIVRMPFKKGVEPVLGDSRKIALATLFQLEKRFKKYPKLREQYSAAIQDAIAQGHMELVKQTPKNPYFVPHHAVFKQSTTTKLRAVYNASQKTDNGMSLNAQLAMGKIEQPSIFELSVKWRKFKIAVVADIEKMYKQISLAEDQRHLLMMLWRDDPNDVIKEYQLTTVTFGVSDAPYLAIRVLKALAKAVENSLPLASRAILDSFYVDDHTGGADTWEEAVELYEQLKKAFKSACCNLRKFISNSPELLNHIPDEDKELIEGDTAKVLGMFWRPIDDAFVFKFKINENTKTSTKREILSEVATMYDPLGLISPIILSAKILVREIWQLTNDSKKYGWDDELPAVFIKKWNKIKSELSLIYDMQIPRWIGISKSSKVELHGFCDACLCGIGAVIYLRFIDSNGIVNVNLLVSKTRVAPLREIKIPRLELMAADLLSKLTKKVTKSMDIEFERVCLWSDSKIVIAWIHGNPKRWKTFVANKVTQINEKIDKSNWFHISGRDNPADCCSRGLLPSELLKHELWWHGPQFLRNKSYNLPNQCSFETNEETKITSLVTTEVIESVPKAKTFHNLKKMFAYVHRFIDNCKQKVNKQKINDGQITLDELNKAETTIIKLVQRDFFSDELEDLKNRNCVKRSSKVVKLCVFLDVEGVIRVGGRLKNAIGLSFEQKHPILMPHRSDVSKLIIREVHFHTFHAGPKLVEATVRQKYWITNCISTITSVLTQCSLCAIYKPKPCTQLMGDLPAARVSEAKKPFYSCAVDFAGPIQTKTSKLRNAKIIKSYIVIFVCLATKALHIDAVSDLTAQSFIAALRRFVSRRGTVEHIYSDNGTNLTKANKILRELSDIEADQFNRELNEECLNRKITWHFSPPKSAHFNGLVEAAVKSTKFHLKRALKYATLTFEELSTLLCQIESTLNSRPLCELSRDPNDTTVITPAHFLNIASSKPVPDEDVSEYKANQLSRWQLVQKINQNFWSKWKNEYLNQLQTRAKWFTEKPEMEIGDLVMLKDDNTPSQNWPMGRITAKHRGEDGRTRVVSIKTPTNVFRRGITELAPLPVTSNQNKKQLVALTALFTIFCALGAPALTQAKPIAQYVSITTNKPIAHMVIGEMNDETIHRRTKRGTIDWIFDTLTSEMIARDRNVLSICKNSTRDLQITVKKEIQTLNSEFAAFKSIVAISISIPSLILFTVCAIACGKHGGEKTTNKRKKRQPKWVPNMETFNCPDNHASRRISMPSLQNYI